MTTDKPNENSDSRIRTSGDVEVSTYLEIAKENRGQTPVAGGSPVSGAERETIIVIDFGSQYSHLIARRIRELHVYCELLSPDTPWEKIATLNPKGFVLSGSPFSAYEEGAPLAPSYIYEKGLPVLGICYGMQVMAYQLGGRVVAGVKKEYGHAILHVGDVESALFSEFPPDSPVWMSHGDRIDELPPGFKSLAHTENSPVAVMGCENMFGLQWHPEVAHSQHGSIILRNFVFNICQCQGNWTMGNFITDSVARIREQVGSRNVISAISGGVDSSVVSILIHKAIGPQLTCIFVNTGLLRREEEIRTLAVFRNNLNVNVVYVNAAERFLNRLKGVVEPETKRKVIGAEFIKIFEEEAAKLGKVDLLAQGTLYPDVIESATAGASAAVKIKSHHNVGGLPSNMTLQLIEPLRYLFKDEVRQVGLELGLPEEMVWRQPFPGPGLAIRVIGEVTSEKLEVLKSADWIVMEEIKRANLYRQLWQSFAILTDVKSVGVMGDYRTYGHVIAVRAVTSNDAMTADWARLPHDVLSTISSRIVNEVTGVNRVVYDITSKPPGTIEWE